MTHARPTRWWSLLAEADGGGVGLKSELVGQLAGVVDPLLRARPDRWRALETSERVALQERAGYRCGLEGMWRATTTGEPEAMRKAAA